MRPGLSRGLRHLPDESRSQIRDGGGAGFRRKLSSFVAGHWVLLLVAAIMLVAFLVRMHYLAQHTEATADSYYFMILGRSVKDTFTYTVRGIEHTKYLPGYPIAIWLGSYLAGGIERSANLLAVLGGTFTVLATYGMGKELFENKYAGVLAGLVVAFQPTFLKWTVLPMTEGLFTFLFATGIYFAITGSKRASPERRALAALCGGLCVLVRWEGVLFLPLMALVLVIYRKGLKLKAWEPAVILALFAVPIGVYATRNLIATGRLTSYVGEFREYGTDVSYEVLKHRVKVYAWQGMSDAIYPALFVVGSVYAAVRRKWRGFLVAVGWYALFVGFHLFWYYAYERFMAPAVPAVGLVIGFLFADLAALSLAALREDGRIAARLAGRPRSRLRSAGELEPALGMEGSGETALFDAEPGAGPRTGETDLSGAPLASGGAGADGLAFFEGERDVPDRGESPSAAGRRRRDSRLPSGVRSRLRVVRALSIVVLVLAFAGVLWHGLARADFVIEQNYKAFADDHGGNGIKKAARWLNRNAPGRLIAANAGPYIDWLYHPGDVLYLRDVPWDLPVEEADVDYADTIGELNARGVEYMVVCEAQQEVEKELDTFAIRGRDRQYLEEIVTFTDRYNFPKPHVMRTAIFRVLPR